jgi:hypothetical protein
VPVTSSAGVTAPGHGGYGPGHGAAYGFHGDGHSDPCHGDRQAGPDSAAAQGQRLSRGGGRAGQIQRDERRPTRLFSWARAELQNSVAFLHGRKQAGVLEFEPEPVDDSESFPGLPPPTRAALPALPRSRAAYYKLPVSHVGR